MINIDNNLILVKGEDKTASIESWEFDRKRGKGKADCRFEESDCRLIDNQYHIHRTFASFYGIPLRLRTT